MSNSRDIVKEVMQSRKSDYAPDFSGMGSITLEAIGQLRYRFNEIHGDGRKMAAAAASPYRLFRDGSAVVPFVIGVLPTSLDTGIKYYDKDDDNQIGSAYSRPCVTPRTSVTSASAAIRFHTQPVRIYKPLAEQVYAC